MKMELYLLKVLESKNIDINEVVKMSDAELDELRLSTKIVYEIKEYIKRGAKSEEEIKNEIDQEMKKPNDERFVPNAETVKQYVVQDDIIATSEEPQVKDDNINDLPVTFEASSEEDELVVQDEPIVVQRQINNPDNIEVIKEALNSKELKTAASYIKHLKTVVASEVLDAVDSTTITAMINERIANIKAK